MKLMTVCSVMALVTASVAALQLLGDKMPSPAALVSDVGDTVGADRKGQTGNAFVTTPMPHGLSPRGVVIFAPSNCPSDAAKRADVLAKYLSERKISYVRASSAEFSNLASREETERVMSVMNGPIPVVYVNGKAKANPRPDEVEAEFIRGGQG